MSLWSLLAGRLIRPSNVHGNASLLRGPARWRLLSRRHGGLCLDGCFRLSAERSFQHLAPVAPTSAGKTTRYPNVLRLRGAAVMPFNPLHRATTHTDIKKVAHILVRAVYCQ